MDETTKAIEDFAVGDIVKVTYKGEVTFREADGAFTIAGPIKDARRFFRSKVGFNETDELLQCVERVGHREPRVGDVMNGAEVQAADLPLGTVIRHVSEWIEPNSCDIRVKTCNGFTLPYLPSVGMGVACDDLNYRIEYIPESD